MQVLILAAGKSSRIYQKILKNKCLIKINKHQTIIEKIINDLNYYDLQKIFISVGFNKKIIINHLNENKNIKFIYNKDYQSTGIVHSMISGLKNMDEEDTLIMYSDIIFNKSIIKRLIKTKPKNITIPVLYDWAKIWKKRGQNIYDDAENLIIKNKQIIEIGTKITDLDKVKHQYMGIVYVPKVFLSSIQNNYLLCKKNIDMTSFINLMVKKNFVFNTILYSGKWYEIDNYLDLINFDQSIRN